VVALELPLLVVGVVLGLGFGVEATEVGFTGASPLTFALVEGVTTGAGVMLRGMLVVVTWVVGFGARGGGGMGVDWAVVGFIDTDGCAVATVVVIWLEVVCTVICLLGCLAPLRLVLQIITPTATRLYIASRGRLKTILDTPHPSCNLLYPIMLGIPC